MKIRFTRRFIRSYDKLPKHIQTVFDDKLHQFMKDWRHPSFRTHELKGTHGLIRDIRYYQEFPGNLAGFPNQMLKRTPCLLKHQQKIKTAGGRYKCKENHFRGGV